MLKEGCHEMVNFVERDKGKVSDAIEMMLPKDPYYYNAMGIGYIVAQEITLLLTDLEIPHVVDMEALAIAKAS